MKKSNLKLFVTKIILILFVSSSIIACKTASTSKVAENEGFVEISNGKNFDGWYLKIKSIYSNEQKGCYTPVQLYPLERLF